ncbi:hypothetical protein EKO04_009532 [Ascochyta lentis]|uniref:Uncharacterized protein n=1 Tax=Ascochyta lentis TaxID=205686 RepID=A0A8H7IZY5_9PLEO|nr:hypothetical protein EKO04_009532 [Ascochyta lentis]
MANRKSRVRFQGRKKNSKQGDGEKTQHESKRTVDIDNSNPELFKGVDEGPLFVKKRVPSVDELGSLLRSNLSTSLASTVKHDATCLPLIPTHDVVAQAQDSYDDPPASFLKLAPIYRPIGDHLEAMNSCAIVDDEDSRDDGPSASLLATTVIYRPAGDGFGPVGGCVVADDHTDEDNEPSPSLLATTELFVPVDDRLEPAAQNPVQTPATVLSAVESCAIEEDDNDPPISLLIESRESFIDYIKPAPRSATVPLRRSNGRPNFLQSVVRLFAGRRRRSIVNEDQPGSSSDQSKVQSQPSTAATNSLSAAPHPRTVSDPNVRSPTPIPRRNLPLCPPVLATHRPYRPLEEDLNEPFIPPAKEHRYTGDYSVARDVFDPVEIHRGFTSPTSPVSPILAYRRQNSAATLLDRDKTAWGKWYAKTSKSESLPFARVKSNGQLSGLNEELTEQQAWDAHRTGLVRAHTDSHEHTSAADESRGAEAAEQERAARLRNHLGHCFGAITGDVYPFQSGRIM